MTATVKLGAAWLILLIGVLMVARFASLDRVPPGFYLDEAAIATQVACIEQTQADASGRAWPLYAPVLAGGQASAPLLYPAALWSSQFGASEAALRAFVAAHGLLLALAIAGAIGITTANWRSAAVCLLLGLCSPWLFVLSRVFWDPIVGATWLGVAFSACWIARQTERPLRQRGMLWCLAAIAAALAAYAYPPLRVQLLASAIVLLAFERCWRIDASFWLGAALFCLLIAPLGLLYLTDAAFAERSQALAIWNPAWLAPQQLSMADVPGIAISNLLENLDPRYLFWRGGINLHHGTGLGGPVGPLELAVLLAALLLAPRLFVSREGLLLLGLFVAGLLPAALTWDRNPHTLRSIGAIAPLLLFIGLAAHRAAAALRQARRGIALIILLAGATTWAGIYGSDYFGDYRARAVPWFEGSAHLADSDPDLVLAKRYYQWRLGQPLDCPGPQ
ncbi:MAG TPA: hypothetical protein VGE51_00490 [Fontimonas sp.]